MAALEQWGVPLAVLGMLLAMLFMAAVVKRYQAHQAMVRATVRRLEQGVAVLSEALAGIKGVPLSRELRVTLRTEVLARYQRIQRLFRRYPGIAERVRQAEAAINAEGAAVGSSVGPIESEQAFRTVLRAIDALAGIFETGATLQPVPRDVRAIFRRELGERRAEVNARFHLVQAKRLESSGNAARARSHLTTLLQVLRTRGPSTDFVRELYAEAESALEAFGNRQVGLSEEGRASVGRGG